MGERVERICIRQLQSCPRRLRWWQDGKTRWKEVLSGAVDRRFFQDSPGDRRVIVGIEGTLSEANQWTAVPPGVSCTRCGRDFVLAVPGETWTDQLFGRLRVLAFRCQVCNARFRSRQATPSRERGLGRRQYLRLPIQLPILIQFRDGSTSTARVKDLSIGGCEIMGTHALERGSTFTIRISGLLYYSGQIDAEVVVVHTARPQAAGLKFIRLSELRQEEFGRALYIAWKIGRNSWPSPSVTS
ncbi:MAG: PilZ domain-containing protein [Nitrospira sp.]|nr:MAG: PilZ domain-containing protein [Nitrospira sp.]